MVLKKSKLYRHLFFDLDRTLWDFETNSSIALEKTLREVNLMHRLPSFEEYHVIYEQINDRLWEQYRKNEVQKSQLTAQRFEDSLAAFGISVNGTAEEINNTYLEFMADQTSLMPGALEMLCELKRRKYQMHIITNGFNEVQNNKIRNSGLASFFTEVFTSEDIGRAKPHRDVFAHAVRTCNARKSESLMIGDNWDADILGARDFGIDQVYFSPNEEIKTEEKPSASTSCVHVKHLSEIPGLLKTLIW